MKPSLPWLSTLAVIAATTATAVAGSGNVVVYTSVDEPFARAILDQFARETGITVEPVFDLEAGKSTGLYRRILAEAESGSPQADLFWSSELFNTILLARQGLLKPYDSPTAADIPKRYRDDQHRWTANAVRARVLAFNPDQGRPEQDKLKWEDLGNPAVARYTVIANPIFGTTRGHVAAMFALWGPERARKFLTNFRDGGGMVVDGNSTALREVIAGRRPFAATDSDDVYVAKKKDAYVDMVYPDMGDGGTLLIPCSVALIADRPDNPAARKLFDFLVSEEVEKALAESDSHNYPVRQRLRNRLDRQFPPESQVPFDKIADHVEEAMKAVREILQQ